MKSNISKRITALLLCMVMLFSSSAYALADETPSDVALIENQEVQGAVVAEEPVVEEPVVEEPVVEEPVVEEPAVEEPVVEEPAVTEEIPEEPIEQEEAVEETVESETELESKPTTGESSGEGTVVEDESTENLPDEGESLTEETRTEPIVLVQEVDGVTITLSGPPSSFEEGKEYSIQATKVEAEDDIAVIEEAIDKAAEEKEKVVGDYQAFDIKLYADGEEVQPLGPVEVRFSGNEVAKSVADAETEVNVIHVDEKTGATQDMDATADAKDVKIETTHFSVYVYVVLEELQGEISLTVEHWANISYIPENLTADAGTNVDQIFDKDSLSINTKTSDIKIYSDDIIDLPNGFRGSVEELSKVCLGDKGNERYKLKAIYRYEDETWTEITEDLTLSEDVRIKLEYETVTSTVAQPTTFFDYNVTDGKLYTSTDSYANHVGTFSGGTATSASNNGTTHSGTRIINGNQQGINALIASNTSKNTAGVYTIGMNSAGVTFTSNSDSNKAAAYVGMKNSSGIQINGSVGAAKNIVKGLTADYSDVIAGNGIYLLPNLFTNQEISGKKVYDGYKLAFERVGDTYTLDAVTNSSGTTLNSASGLKTIEAYNTYWGTVYSNNFWPMDNLAWYSGRDPLMGKYLSGNYGSNLKAPIYYNGSNLACNDEGHYGKSTAAHNWFFGMRYDFEFTVGDYEGPMNFYFRGDDDFWLFIDGKLAVDIGGIHSAIGESLNVREFIEENGLIKETDEDGRDITNHRLTVIYTERGGTGSCCYMQFTIPNVEPVDVSSKVEYTSVSVEKKWNDGNEITERPASIEVQLLQDGTVVDTKQLGTGNSWKYTWNGIAKKNPVTNQNYTYTVREVSSEGLENYSSVTTQKSGTTNSYVITNTKLTDVTVHKIWEDDQDIPSFRLDEITIQLYANNEKVTTNSSATLNASNSWSAEFTRLKKYDTDGNLISYTVKEMNGTEALESGQTIEGKHEGVYVVSYETEDGYDYTVKNTLLKQRIQITKKSLVNDTLLRGAEFKLESLSNESFITKVEVTNENGLIEFELPCGTYKLTETKAPEGHMLLEHAFVIQVTKEEVAYWIDEKGNDTNKTILDQNGTIYVMDVINAPLVELPETGGTGIYWSMLSGMLLMISAAFVVYKNKCNELLEE